jgi:hypothetical protein
LRRVFALEHVHLLLTNTTVAAVAGVDLVLILRAKLSDLPILYIANIDRSTPAIEERLPRNVPILREPFTATELREVVASLLAPKQGLPLGAGKS